MARGQTRSGKTLSERREEASGLYTKGFTVADVARKLGVSWDTAKAYKGWHEKQIQKVAAAQPQLLQDVLKNTVQMIAELDQVRAAAWRQYHLAESKQVRLQALNTVRACQADKAKLFGLFGVKQEMYAAFSVVKIVQDRILAFLQRELCEEDRKRLEAFLTGPEMAQYMGIGELPALPPVTDDDEIVDAELVGA